MYVGSLYYGGTMYFRNFSVKVVSNQSDYGTTEETAYPVIALHTGNGKLFGSGGAASDSTAVLIPNDTFKLTWVPVSDCEQVDFT